MKKTYIAPKYKTISLDGEVLMQPTSGPSFQSEEQDEVGSGVQLVKGHSAWDDEW